MGEPEPAVEVRGLTVQREGRPVLSRVSLDVTAGSVHVLAGPNGAGKSTLLAAILGQLPFTGTVRLRLGGEIAFVPQRFQVDRTLPLSVLDFLALRRTKRPVCLGVAPALRARGEALLARVGLEGFSGRSLGSLSGGELQRVLLANALEPAPALLLLDEPGAGLDAASSGRLEEEVRRLKAAGATVLMVSHDAAQATRIADRVTVLEGGIAREGG